MNFVGSYCNTTSQEWSIGCVDAGVEILFHTCDLTSPGLFVNDFLLTRQIPVLAEAGENFCVHPGKLRLAFSYFAFFSLQLFRDHRQVLAISICYLLTWKIVSDFADSWSVDLQYFRV
jgi:hypothetical protein